MTRPSAATSPLPPRDQAMELIKAGLSYRANPVVRAQSVEALESVGTAEALPWIRSALLDEHAGVRFAACMVLGRARDQGGLAGVRKCLDDPDHSVRVAALFAMHRLGHKDRTNRLPNYLLLDSDPIVRRNAAIAISLLGEKSAVTVLARAMKDSDPGVRNHALEGMARLGNQEAARELTFMANSGIGSEEVFAINALSETGDPVYEDTFRYKLANGAHLETRLAAARALGRLRIDAGLPVVLEALRPNPPLRTEPEDPPAEQLLRIRQLAAGAAGAIGSDQALALLHPYLQDSTDPRVQIAVARAIIEISRHPMNRSRVSWSSGSHRMQRREIQCAGRPT